MNVVIRSIVVVEAIHANDGGRVTTMEIFDLLVGMNICFCKSHEKVLLENGWQ